jgi:galactokinase/mevalonate kinase-like predicted kinase
LSVHRGEARGVVLVRSKAPLRISFAGGTEVEPYLSERGGAVLSSTIDKYAYGSLYFNEDPSGHVSSLDYDVVAKYDADEPLIEGDKLNLVKADIRRLSPESNSQGIDIFLHRHIAVALKNALLRGKPNDFGALLHEAWINKNKMAAQISNPYIDELYETARKRGVLGGKISAAGGGGYMFFYCDFKKKHIVAEQLERLGAQVVEFDFDFGGLQTWEVR